MRVVSERAPRELRAVERAVLVEDVLAERAGELLSGGLAGLDDLAGDLVGVDDDAAVGLQLAGDGRLPAADASGEPDLFHGPRV